MGGPPRSRMEAATRALRTAGASFIDVIASMVEAPGAQRFDCNIIIHVVAKSYICSGFLIY